MRILTSEFGFDRPQTKDAPLEGGARGNMERRKRKRSPTGKRVAITEDSSAYVETMTTCSKARGKKPTNVGVRPSMDAPVGNASLSLMGSKSSYKCRGNTKWPLGGKKSTERGRSHMAWDLHARIPGIIAGTNTPERLKKWVSTRRATRRTN